MAVEAFDTRPRLRLRDGWVSRHYKPTVPPQVTYALTKRVFELQALIEDLDRIAERWYGSRRTSS